MSIGGILKYFYWREYDALEQAVEEVGDGPRVSRCKGKKKEEVQATQGSQL